jgi:UDP-2-acetamido-2,6-beta-L-arabino-hexul-4-ose reductase
MNILITGSKGFVGRNLVAALRRRDGLSLFEYDLGSHAAVLDEALRRADVIFHLAGVNRPQAEETFHIGNTGSTEEICRQLIELGRRPKIVLSSSIQAELDNPYGVSKRNAEDVLRRFAGESGAACVVYRFKNLFGKWCRPNYNSVTATFCHNIAHDLPIQISDPANKLALTYIDDVVAAFVNEIDAVKTGFNFAEALPSTQVTLGQLADKIKQFRQMRIDLILPDFRNAFDHALYATYLSYLDGKDFAYGLEIKSDQRGSLAEFIKSPSMGQIFISHTRPGIVRGDHYHHTKTEKFLVVQGEAVIRFRQIESDKIIEHRVCGEDYRVLDIPPGYTHSIENIGRVDLVTLLWASEMFDPAKPDTIYEKVQPRINPS